MNRIAVIVAGGSGTRMGGDIPKQFLTINGKAIFLYTIEAFLKAYPDINIILVLHKDYISYTRQLLEDAEIRLPIEIVEGGDSRFQSVKNGLQKIKNESIVFVHDAVRCLISTDLIKRCSDFASEHGSAIPVVPVRDSIRKFNKSSGISESVSREDLYIVQTPQTFRSDILLPAFDVEYHEGFTDEATVVENKGGKVSLIKGEEQNIKITFPEDITFAAWRLS